MIMAIVVFVVAFIMFWTFWNFIDFVHDLFEDYYSSMKEKRRGIR